MGHFGRVGVREKIFFRSKYISSQIWCYFILTVSWLPWGGCEVGPKSKYQSCSEWSETCAHFSSSDEIFFGGGGGGGESSSQPNNQPNNQTDT